jgi:NAD(P)-dependent dehydrogenase (short-subunit alcohol dehydrogenase family)
MSRFLNQFDLTGKVAVVTGASEGIGEAIALGLADVGADTVLCSRRKEKLDQVKVEIEKMGRRAEVFAMDVSHLKEIENLKEFVLQKFGRADILVNNAAFTVTKPAWEVTEEEWDVMIDTGFKGLFFCCQKIGSIMQKQKYGKIINLSSTFSRSIIKGRSVYGGIKAGVSHLTEALAFEWASEGIRVNAIGPTAVRTPTREDTLKGERLQNVISRIPLGRLAVPDDLIGAAIFLSSPASDFVTGHTLFVDGGWVAAS